MKRRLLVTGGAGFIGSHFVEHCLRLDLVDRLVVVDVLTYAGNPRHLDGVIADPRFRFVEADICDASAMERLLASEALDGIVNFAAETHVDRSIRDPAPFVRTNVMGVQSLVEAARHAWLLPRRVPHRFHQVSTDEVFGPGPEDGGWRDEQAAYAPSSPYAATKAAADQLVRAWRVTHGLEATISYSSNVYGPRQYPEKLIPMAIRRLLQGGRVPVYGDGRQARSWLHVHDCCRALALFLSVVPDGARLNLGSVNELENRELLARLVAVAQRMGVVDPGVPVSTLLEPVPDRPGHDRRYGLGSRAFATLTGFREGVSLDEGLAGTIRHAQSLP